MVRTLPCRHAHTCGLTYCTVGMPCALSRAATRRLNSGESMPTKTSGRAASNRATRSRRSRSRRGRCFTISARPITASSSDDTQASQPASTMRGPATPYARSSGRRACSARSNPPPRLSPEASPATSAIFNSPVAAGEVMTGLSLMRLSARGCAWTAG